MPPWSDDGVAKAFSAHCVGRPARGAGFCAAVLALSSGVADAQAQNPIEDSERVVVTAQRRPERLLDVPISIISRTAGELEDAGVASMLDLQQVAPGVIVNRFGYFTAPAIRGVSTRVVGPGADNNVATYVDGFYVANAMALNRGFGDIERIDILKGPQGTAFGRNATGGAIMIRTRDPSHDTQFSVRGFAETFDGRGADIYGTTGLGDGLAINASASLRESDGWIRNTAPGLLFDTAPRESQHYRAKLSFEPSDDVAFMFSAEYGHAADGTAVALSYFAHPNPVIPPTLIARPNETSLSHPEMLDAIWRAYNVRATFDLGGATLMSLTGYRLDTTSVSLDFDGSPLGGGLRNSANALQRFPQETFSQEVNLASTGDGRLQWGLGGYFYADDSRTDSILPNRARLDADTAAWAAYADITWEAADRLFLTAGARFNQEKRSCAIAAGLAPLLTPCGPDRTDDAWTPRAVARYQLRPDASVYASYSRGFKSGSFNATRPFAFVEPETVDAYEAGYKTREGRWRLEASAFFYDYRNIQYSSFCTVGACAGTLQTANAAESEIYGAEMAFSAELTERFSLSVGIAYTHARFKQFPNASGDAPAPCANPDQALCPNVTALQDWSGQQMTRAPDWSANLGFTYRLPTDLGEFDLTGNAYWVDDYQPNSDSLPCATANCGAGLSPRFVSGAHAITNASLNWTHSNGDVSASLYVRNLFDETYIIQTDANGIGDWRVYGEPRIIGLRFGYAY